MRTGRPSFLESANVTVQELENDLSRLGTYAKVAEKYGVTRRTVQKYLSGKGTRGRPKGSYSSEARYWVEKDLTVLQERDIDVLEKAKKDNISPSYLRKVLQSKRALLLETIQRRVRGMLRGSKAILDTKGRYIPTAAVRYVWLPKWEFGRPLYVKVVLRDGTKAKLPTLYRPSVEDARELSATELLDDQGQ